MYDYYVRQSEVENRERQRQQLFFHFVKWCLTFYKDSYTCWLFLHYDLGCKNPNLYEYLNEQIPNYLLTLNMTEFFNKAC